MSQSPSNASRQRQTLLLAWRERDESLTWWWQDNRRSANGNLLFLGKARSVAPKDVYRSSIFFFPRPSPPPPHPCAGGQKIPCGIYFILSPALDGLWREYRGSVNRLSSIGSRTFTFQLGTQSWWHHGGRSRFRPVVLMIIVEVVKIAKWDCLHFLKNMYHGAYINQV